MGYLFRERIFSACGSDLSKWTAVFSANDLTDDECQTLEASVQQCLDELHEGTGGGPWFISLGPSADEDCAAFVNLKSQWNSHEADIEEYRRSSPNSWQSGIVWFHDIVREHADIIRQIRCGRAPVVYLQCDQGGTFETFDRIDSLTEAEIGTLEEVLTNQLYKMGLMLRIVSDWHAEKEPAEYVQARLSWKRFEESVKEDDADETLLAASGASFECCNEIKELRKKPRVYDEFDEDEGYDDEGETEAPEPPKVANSDLLVAPGATLRQGYKDPDNYWRNVWLYQQRQAGKTNSTILAELMARADEFAPIETENALRSAIESIAYHHKWPPIKGRPGRPRAKTDTAQ